MKQVNEWNSEIEKLRSVLENDEGDEDAQQEVIDLEQDIKDMLQQVPESEAGSLHALLKKINSMKKEFDFYDEESEMDRMFPNRKDKDFDNDSTSFDSVFGKD